MAQPRRPLNYLTVLSGPAGVGKQSIIAELPKHLPQIRTVTSDTTRPMRPGEVDGVDRNFITDQEFRSRIAADHYLEYAVYAGFFYGSPRVGVETIVSEGNLPLLEIEVQGARQVMGQVPEALSIFLLPPSWGELERRLTGRGTEAPEVVSRRLAAARLELAEADNYRHRVINRDVDEAAIEVACLIRSRRSFLELTPDLYNQALAG